MKSTPSSAPSLDSSRWTEATAATDLLRTLVRGLTRAQGFSLFFAVCNQPVERERLIAMLREALPSTPWHRVQLDAQTTDVLSELSRQVPQPQGPVLIVDLEHAVSSDRTQHPVLTRLNLQRPRWTEQLAQPVVFWVPQYVLGFFEREAPDFFDWRSNTLVFPEMAEAELEFVRRFAWSPAVDGSLTERARLARIEELRERLAKLRTGCDSVERLARASWLREMGHHLAILGNIDQALHALEESLTSFNELRDQQAKAVLIGDIARLRRLRGEVDEALRLQQERLHISKELGDDRERALTLGEIARVRAERGEVEAALELHRERLAILEALGDNRSRAVAMGDIARILEEKGKVDAALRWYRESLNVFEALGDKRARAITLGDIARIRADRGEVDAALESQQEVLKIGVTLGDKELCAGAKGNIARLRASKGDLNGAIELLQDALRICKELGNRFAYAVTLADIGRLRWQKGESETALQLFQEAHGVFVVLGAKREQAVTMGDMARLRVEKGELDIALQLHQKALEIIEASGSKAGIANCLWDRAQISQMQGEFEQATQDIIRSYQLVVELGKLDAISIVGLTLGDLLCRSGHADRGLPILTRSRDGFRQLGRAREAEQAQALLDQFSSSASSAAPGPVHRSP